MNKAVRKALTSGICLIIGIILILIPVSYLFAHNGTYLFISNGIIFGSLGLFFIIVGVAYRFYIWPDELHSGKETEEEDLAIDIDECSDSSQNRDPENIYQAGMFYGMGQGRAYFGGADLLRPNRPKDR